MKGHRRNHVTPNVGSIFKRSWKGITHVLTVVNIDGAIMYQIDKELFSTPSGAAKFITKQEVNGWRFWKIDKAPA